MPQHISPFSRRALNERFDPAQGELHWLYAEDDAFEHRERYRADLNTVRRIVGSWRTPEGGIPRWYEDLVSSVFMYNEFRHSRARPPESLLDALGTVPDGSGGLAMRVCERDGATIDTDMEQFLRTYSFRARDIPLDAPRELFGSDTFKETILAALLAYNHGSRMQLLDELGGELLSRGTAAAVAERMESIVPPSLPPQRLEPLGDRRPVYFYLNPDFDRMEHAVPFYVGLRGVPASIHTDSGELFALARPDELRYSGDEHRLFALSHDLELASAMIKLRASSIAHNTWVRAAQSRGEEMLSLLYAMKINDRSTLELYGGRSGILAQAEADYAGLQDGLGESLRRTLLHSASLVPLQGLFYDSAFRAVSQQAS